MWSLHLMTSEERRAWLENPMERFKTFEEEDRTSNEPMPPVVSEWEREDEEWEASYGRDAEDARSG